MLLFDQDKTPQDEAIKIEDDKESDIDKYLLHNSFDTESSKAGGRNCIGISNSKTLQLQTKETFGMKSAAVLLNTRKLASQEVDHAQTQRCMVAGQNRGIEKLHEIKLTDLRKFKFQTCEQAAKSFTKIEEERKRFLENENFFIMKIVKLQTALDETRHRLGEQKVQLGQKLADARSELTKIKEKSKKQETMQESISKEQRKKEENFKQAVQSEAQISLIKYKQEFTEKHGPFVQYKNMAATLQADLDVLRNEKKFQDEKMESLQAELSNYVAENAKLKQKLKSLEYINQKNMNQLKIYQEMKYIRAKSSQSQTPRKSPKQNLLGQKNTENKATQINMYGRYKEFQMASNNKSHGPVNRVASLDFDKSQKNEIVPQNDGAIHINLNDSNSLQNNMDHQNLMQQPAKNGPKKFSDIIKKDKGKRKYLTSQNPQMKYSKNDDTFMPGIITPKEKNLHQANRQVDEGRNDLAKNNVGKLNLNLLNERLSKFKNDNDSSERLEMQQNYCSSESQHMGYQGRLSGRPVNSSNQQPPQIFNISLKSSKQEKNGPERGLQDEARSDHYGELATRQDKKRPINDINESPKIIEAENLNQSQDECKIAQSPLLDFSGPAMQIQTERNMNNPRKLNESSVFENRDCNRPSQILSTSQLEPVNSPGVSPESRMVTTKLGDPPINLQIFEQELTAIIKSLKEIMRANSYGQLTSKSSVSPPQSRQLIQRIQMTLIQKFKQALTTIAKANENTKMNMLEKQIILVRKLMNDMLDEQYYPQYGHIEGLLQPKKDVENDNSQKPKAKQISKLKHNKSVANARIDSVSIQLFKM